MAGVCLVIGLDVGGYKDTHISYSLKLTGQEVSSKILSLTALVTPEMLKVLR